MFIVRFRKTFLLLFLNPGSEHVQSRAPFISGERIIKGYLESIARAHKEYIT